MLEKLTKDQYNVITSRKKQIEKFAKNTIQYL